MTEKRLSYGEFRYFLIGRLISESMLGSATESPTLRITKQGFYSMCQKRGVFLRLQSEDVSSRDYHAGPAGGGATPRASHTGQGTCFGFFPRVRAREGRVGAIEWSYMES